MTPADLFARNTPHQLAAVFLDAAGTVTEDKLAMLAAANRAAAARGHQPFCPSWLAARLRPAGVESGGTGRRE